MNDIFKLKINGRDVCDKYKLNVRYFQMESKKFGYKSFKVQGP